jgi:hypothetical protein
LPRQHLLLLYRQHLLLSLLQLLPLRLRPLWSYLRLL